MSEVISSEVEEADEEAPTIALSPEPKKLVVSFFNLVQLDRAALAIFMIGILTGISGLFGWLLWNKFIGSLL